VLVTGRVLHSYGDIDKEGELKHVVALDKILDVKISIEPKEFPQNPTLDSLTNKEKELVRITLTLRTISGSINIKCTNHELGPSAVLFFKDMDPDKKFSEMINLTGLGYVILKDQSIGIVPQSWTASMLLEVGRFPRGNYKIIPYFSIPQESVPQELLDSLGNNVTFPILTYLNLPMKREGGDFKIYR
jgi:hypothetical protein